MALNLDEFRLTKLVLELKYNPAFLLWDYIGEFWHEIGQKERDLKSITTEPNNTTFRSGNDFELNVGIEGLKVTGHHTKGKDFLRVASFFSETAIETFNIEALKKISLRATYRRPQSSLDEADRAIQKLGYFSVNAPKIYGIEEGKSTRPSLALAFEGPATGARIRLSSQTEVVEFNPPINIREFSSERKESHFIEFDVTYYTMIETLVGQFKPDVWMERVLHVIRRDSNVVLAGNLAKTSEHNYV